MVQEFRPVPLHSARHAQMARSGDPAPPAAPRHASEAAAVLLEAVSREMRTTLAIANGYCQTLLHIDLDDVERARCLERIAAANDHIADLSNEMLELTAAGEGGHPVCRPVAISAVMAQLRRQLGEAEDEPRFVARLPIDLPLVIADPLWIVNVLKVMVATLGGDPPADQRLVHLDVRTTQDRVVISARVGEGREPIPGRYVPTSSTRVLALRVGSGESIAQPGLELCRQLVEAQRGVMWIDERPSETRISFTLPRFWPEEASAAESRCMDVPCLERV